VAGTASVFAATVADFAPDLVSRIMGCGRSSVPGLWHPYAYINGGGLNLNWFVESVSPRDGAGVDAGLARLGAAMAALEPRSDDPYFIPHLEGRGMPSDPEMRGSWAGIGRGHGESHLYKAILESVALEYAIYRDAVRALHPGLSLEELRGTGGGSKEPAWNAIKADALGMRVIAVEDTGGAPMGAALVAARAAGAVGDLAVAANSWVRLGVERAPDPKRADVYERRLVHYKRLLEALSGFPGKEEY
jgi:xylulokinase